jgi:hypothetical protein
MDIPVEELYIRYSATEYDVDLSLDWVSRWERVNGVRPNMIARRRSCKKSGLVHAMPDLKGEEVLI